MAVTVYKSTDASAPVLSGTNGALIGVLDACLVNGYGAKSAAGWAKSFSATNKAVYRMATSGNTGFYLNVQDNGPGAGTAREARVWGYEIATAQDIGTNQFPTTGQLTNGLFLRKSATADATARPWIIVADSSVFYLFVETGDYTSPTQTMAFMFGDFFSYVSGDANRCIIIGRTTENTSSYSAENFCTVSVNGSTSYFAININGHYIARGTAGIGGSIPVSKHTDSGKHFSTCIGGLGNSFNNNSGGISFLTSLTYPNQADNGLWIAPIYLHHNNGVRGYLKGLWSPLHDLPIGHGDTVSGTGTFSSKTFIGQRLLGNDTSADDKASALIETSDTWS